ncbi:hypothetical protein BDZ97DRAFT_1666634 [Flammula alnicola]|nr:hypothetical protein BDZ97DRAFT_1666634 [Flammula alnicola]
MRNSLPLLSRSPVATTATPQAGPPIPSIRLISATPSATGLSSEASTSFNRSLEESWATMPSPLAPKTAEADPARRRLVPKKSKLSILGVGRDKEKERGKDFSDVIRRVGADYASSKGGIEIYVDPTIDPDIGEIVMVKKKKSRVALDGMAWSANDVTNVPKVTPKEAPTLLKVKTEEKEKWWSIGRGRKDSKEKTKEAKENKITSDGSSARIAVEYIHDPHPRSKSEFPSFYPIYALTYLSPAAPEPFKSTPTQESRGRFNSLDSGILLNGPINTGPAPGSVRGPHTLNFPEDQFPSSGEPSPVNLTYSRSGTPTAGGLLAPPSTLAVPGSGSNNNNNQGSIAIRAMRSVRSLARMGSWAQLKNMPPPEDKDAAPAASTKEKKKSVKEKAAKEKTVKEKTVKEKKKAKENRVEEEKGAEKEKKKKSVKKEKEKAQTVRQSSSSFEVGALTASPGSDAAKTLGPKKRSILGLGLGLPSTVRLPSVRAGSTASSNINIGAANPAPGPGPVSSYHRLSADSALQLNRAASTTERRGSVVSSASAGSSLRPLSTTSSTSRASSRSSGGSVRWDEEGLETVREQRNKEREERRKDEERAERRTSRESKHSVEGRRRTSLAAVFPEVQPQQQPVMGSPASVASTATAEGRRHSYPILTIEEATVDGHGVRDDDEMVVEEEKCQEEEVVQPSVAATPVKKARARPLSEQLLGKSRPKPMYEEDEGVLSILDAATNDLALLINNLDLQATPSTPDLTPFRPSPLSTVEKATPTGGAGFDGSPKNLKKHLVAESPLKKSYLATVSSVSSLRPYAQSRGYSKPTTTTTTTTAASSASNNVNAALIAKQIAPWATLMQGLSPVKEKPKATNNKATPTPPAASSSTFRPGHKRTMTPAPEPEPEPVFQPLRPARSRAMFPPTLLKVPVSPVDNDDSMDFGQIQERAPSSMTFGSRGSRGSRGSMDEYSGSLTPVFKRIHEQESERERKRSRASLVPPPPDLASSRSSRSSQGSQRSSFNLSAPTTMEECRVPIARETRKVLGMSGTMGGSDVSCYQAPEPDASDPDSDVPDELRFILATHSDRGSIAESLSYGDIGDAAMRPSSPTDDMDIDAVPTRLSDSGPPTIALPVFRASLVDDEDNRCEVDEGANTSDEDTKKSFDFTGELQKLNESGGSDRRSFVEQLENAFRTPAKVDLRYDFGVGALVEVPPVPELPVDFRMAVDAESSGSSNATSSSSDSNNGSSSGFDGYSSGSKLMDVKQPSILEKTSRPEFDSMQDSKSHFDMFSASRIVDIKEPTMLQGSDSLGSSNDTEDSLFSLNSSPGLQPSPAASNRPSDGQLNTSFRFGGLPRMESTKSLPKDEEKPLTLSDIIPPPSHVRSLSESFNLDAFEDDSVLKSIYAKIVADVPPARPRVNSDSSTRQSARDKRRSIYKAMSRPTSGISFEGFDSFEEVRRGFEFSTDRPAFYPPPAVAASGAYRRAPHRRHESVFSIASVSSYGHVINSGSNDPFDYGLPMPSLRERPSSEDMSSISMSLGDLEDTFAFVHNKPRRRVESDASSFYFRAPAPQQIGAIRGHRRRESNMSTSSQAPPISLYNRSFGHRRNDSTASASSVALSYARHGANNGFSAWARHRKDQSMDSVMSDFSGMHIGRPGLGDKMFDTQVDLGPLSSISASPPESASRPTFAADCTSYDSVIDEQRSSLENSDSIFERTGYDHHRESVSSDSVFGDDFAQVRKDGLLPPVQFRRLSIRSSNSVHSPMKEDDTMISMLGGGGHVRRRSIEASPCPHVEKRKHSAIQGIQMYKGQDQYDSPNKARIVEKPSIASTSSFQFGGERMIKAQHGLLERQSLEDSCLIADGEELSAYRAVPVFSRPGPAARSRSSTCTSSSGTDTPPLSASDGSSMSEGSQSSIDLSQINVALSNATHPMSTFSMNRVRARARGTGHRRRYSKAHISRSSVYETIEEEMMSSHSSSPAQSLLSKKSSPTTRQAIFIVDHDTASINSQPEEPTWDDERGIVALRKYYALRDEAHTTVSESRPFQAPAEPAGMQALLEHSVQTYGPLPSDLRPRRMRSRTSSRPSPYPQARISKGTLSPEQTRISNSIIDHQRTPVLQQKPVNKNIHMMATAPSLEALKPFSPLVMDIEPKRENAFGLAPNVRPRVGSTARRTALGWSKRSNGNGKSSTDQKENVAATGIVMTPGDTLRLNRPRARGRPTPGGRTPASQNRAIRI